MRYLQPIHPLSLHEASRLPIATTYDQRLSEVSCSPCFGKVEPIYDTPYSVQTSEAEIQTEMIKISKDVHIQTESSENPVENRDDGGTITVYAMAMA